MHATVAVMASLHLERRTVSMDTTSNVSMDTSNAEEGGVGANGPAMDIELEMLILNTVLVSNDSNLKDVCGSRSKVYGGDNNFDLSDDWLSKTDLDDFQSPHKKCLCNKTEE